MISIFLLSSESSLDCFFIWSESIDFIGFWFFELWIPFNVLSTYLYGFNLLTMTNTWFGSKLIIETRTILLGKQYYTLNGPNHLFLNLPKYVFSPLGNHKTLSPNWNFFFVFFCWLHKYVPLVSFNIILSF